MNDKVKELVERVKLTPEEIDAKYVEAWESQDISVDSPLKQKQLDGDVEIDVLEELCQAQLNKVLNDPDLALIDRDDHTYPDMTFFCTNCKTMQKNALCNILGDKTHNIIHLAETLKEIR